MSGKCCCLVFWNSLKSLFMAAFYFYAYDTYRKQLLKVSRNEETTNFERFLAGAAAGITATILCSHEQMELGPMRTLLYGAIADTFAEAATYPFEVVRRQLQMQVQATKLSALATCAKIVERRGIPALERALTRFYSDLIPLVENFVSKLIKLNNKTQHCMDADRMVMTGNHSTHDDGMGFWKFMLAGSVADVVEHMAMFPVDTLKIRMQMSGTTSIASSSAHHHNTGKVFTSIMRKEGPLGFYCGIGAIGLGVGLAHAILFHGLRKRLQLKKSPYSGVKDCVTRMLKE
ncbi:hypothetical protein IFM89_011260 [Coptis chinensis]|uniref:Mitochondrial carrier protein n=1 Tax=Coptis chinensis TaxID=261450 RepID=A0A835HAQ2_9MAGN|nr:hypothetical protein IFM89_011260 [Coptis chinensis]